ncbi:MAG: metallophosphoesterase [Anaerolineae bacterium]
MSPALDNIPPDREDGSSSFVHQALIATGHLGQVNPLFLLPLWALLALIIGLFWGPFAWAAALAFACLILVDWVLLACLPYAGRSWGPVTPSLLGLGLVHALLFGLSSVFRLQPIALGIVILVNALITVIAFYATWIEPFRIEVAHRTYPVAGGGGDRPRRFAHVSDIHFEGPSPRERGLLELLKAHAPDVVLLTGDYLNLSSVYDPEAQQGVRELLASIEAPLGIYAITGSPVVDIQGIVPEIFEGLPIHWLDDDAAPIVIDECPIWLMGVRNTYNEARDAAALQRLAAALPEDSTRILLYHTPDLMPVAAALGIDLYLCGHTHGGQLRLPFYGALATSSKWGKRYEHGAYREGNTTLYVSRGLGVEGLGAPRARFLAPPEIIFWDFKPSDVS